MGNSELSALVIGLIGLCQRYELLPTTTDELADELQTIAADMIYISKMDLSAFLES